MVQGGGRVDNKACRRPRVGFYREVRVETVSGLAMFGDVRVDTVSGCISISVRKLTGHGKRQVGDKLLT